MNASAAATPNGELHDDAGELEHDFGQRLTESDHRVLGAAAHLRETDGKQHRPEDDLQHLVGRRGFEEALRHDVFEDARECDLIAADRRSTCGDERHADARLQDVDGKQPDDQRQRRHDLEVDDCLDAHAPDVFQVAMRGDADNERGKQQRRDDGANQADEDGAENPQLCRGVREEVAERAADDDGDENPGCEGIAALRVG